jgi:hypothetical protein
LSCGSFGTSAKTTLGDKKSTHICTTTAVVPIKDRFTLVFVSFN